MPPYYLHNQSRPSARRLDIFYIIIIVILNACHLDVVLLIRVG